MGKALMAQASITKLESVIAGIRGYLSEQLGELDGELDAARKEVAELSGELASRQASVEVLVAGRNLLVTKLGELDGAVAETAAVPQARQSPEDVGEKSSQETVAPADVDVVAAEPPATEPGSSKAETPLAVARALNASQRDVLGFLESTPGTHKVAEIATAVNGPDAGSAAVQAVRRALAVLTDTGRATKQTQSGAAFYSATATAPKAAEEAQASLQDADADGPTPAAETRTSASKTARSAKAAGSKKAAARKATSRSAGTAATTTPAATAEPVAESTVPSEVAPASVEAGAPERTRKAAGKRGTAKGIRTTSAPAEKTVRADRPKIVAVLLGSPVPQSAAEVSRTVMGSQWKSSDATNFRNVLKSMVAEGVVAEHVGENNRSRYTVAAST
jgi:Fe2+ or Zn2+ uptake regulation protein